jgi:predicted DCC family thiol-disulfide oxidoreductase YuxK
MADGTSSPATRPLVLFDGACPMCRREIAHYQRVRGGNGIEWIDLAPLPDGPVIDDVDRATAMARMHVRDANGRWHTGAAAFVELWRHLSGYRWLARTVSALRLTRPLDAVYRRFARWRVARDCGSTCSPALPDSRRPSHAETAPRPGVPASTRTGDTRG